MVLDHLIELGPAARKALKAKKPNELLEFAEELEIENASSMRKQDMMFAILKQLAAKEIDIIGEGVVEVLSDGFRLKVTPRIVYGDPAIAWLDRSQIRAYGKQIPLRSVEQERQLEEQVNRSGLALNLTTEREGEGAVLADPSDHKPRAPRQPKEATDAPAIIIQGRRGIVLSGQVTVRFDGEAAPQTFDF